MFLEGLGSTIFLPACHSNTGNNLKTEMLIAFEVCRDFLSPGSSLSRRVSCERIGNIYVYFLKCLTSHLSPTSKHFGNEIYCDGNSGWTKVHIFDAKHIKYL